MELARSLRQQYPAARLQIHGRFQTAALLWHKDPELGSLWIDIATARTEFYPYPAANPEVEASSIRQDLYRRDFTINALAIRLTQPHAGELLDFFGGLLDLEAKLVRVLHANSFIEDPTRIYRAVRFAVRLGFQLEAQTEGFIRYAIDSGVYHRTQGENHRAPALQTRLKSELKYILQTSYWQPALQLLGDLGALRCIHPTLELTPDLWKSLRLLHTIHTSLRTNVERTGEWPFAPTWQLLLETLIAHLAPDFRQRVATNLQLPADSIERLSHLAEARAEIAAQLPHCPSTSAKVHCLSAYDVPTLVLIAAQSPVDLRRPLWCYLSRWMHIKPWLDGDGLLALGYKPGKQFKPMLGSLLAATLDGEITSREQAEVWVRSRYPLSG